MLIPRNINKTNSASFIYIDHYKFTIKEMNQSEDSITSLLSNHIRLLQISSPLWNRSAVTPRRCLYLNKPAINGNEVSDYCIFFYKNNINYFALVQFNFYDVTKLKKKIILCPKPQAMEVFPNLSSYVDFLQINAAILWAKINIWKCVLLVVI